MLNSFFEDKLLEMSNLFLFKFFLNTFFFANISQYYGIVCSPFPHIMLQSSSLVQGNSGISNPKTNLFARQPSWMVRADIGTEGEKKTRSVRSRKSRVAISPPWKKIQTTTHLSDNHAMVRQILTATDNSNGRKKRFPRSSISHRLAAPVVRTTTPARSDRTLQLGRAGQRTAHRISLAIAPARQQPAPTSAP
jgi:hypothetical protein